MSDIQEHMVLADPEKISLTFNAIRIRQPIGDFYVCTMDYKAVQKITFFDVRRVLRDERDIERYLGIQRPISEPRIRDLEKYVNFKDATFPSSIILAVREEYAEFDEKKNEIRLSNFRGGEPKPSIALSDLCRVLDGQHRVAGLAGFGGDCFDVVVSLFVGADIADQAYIFATVNLEQNKVSKSLTYDLYELARTRSPQKTCHNIAVALDRTPQSPFYNRIKRLGVVTPGRGTALQTITQATFVESLLDYISNDPKSDRDRLLRGKPLVRPNDEKTKRLVLRNLFIDQDDLKIGKIIENYFLAVSKRWNYAWNSTGTGYILNRTNGFKALMKIFGRAYSYYTTSGELVSAEQFLKLFNKVNAKDDFFTTDNFKPGSSGESSLANFLLSEMKL